MKTDTPPQPMRIRVLVADSHPVVRYGLTSSLSDEHDIEVVGCAGSEAETLAMIGTNLVDVVTLGAAFGAQDGVDVAKNLRDRYQDLGIVIFAALSDDTLLFRALDSGASAFLSDDADICEIVATIRHAAGAARSFTSAGLADAIRRQREAPASAGLSAREQQVLKLLSQGYSVPAVARELYVSHSTAKTYVARVYEKFGVNNRAHALVHAMQCGLLQVAPGGSSSGLVGRMRRASDR